MEASVRMRAGDSCDKVEWRCDTRVFSKEFFTILLGIGPNMNLLGSPWLRRVGIDEFHHSSEWLILNGTWRHQVASRIGVR